MSQETDYQERLRTVALAYGTPVEDLVRALDWLRQGNGQRMREFGLLDPPADPDEALTLLHDRVQARRT